MTEDFLEAWRTNNRINLFLIDHISDAGMRCTLSKRGGRDVARQFGHLHDNRVWQLEKRARDLAAGLEVFESKTRPTKKQLRAALTASGTAIEAFFSGLLSGAASAADSRRGCPPRSRISSHTRVTKGEHPPDSQRMWAQPPQGHAIRDLELGQDLKPRSAHR